MRATNISLGTGRSRPLTRRMDLNLLELFESIYRTGNLSATGRYLGLSQPAVSRGLARLRAMYDDVLFVRHQRGVLPTPFADGLIEPVTSALLTIRNTVEKPSFDPGSSRRTFRIATSDIGEHFFLPRLCRHIALAAPFVRLDVVSFPEVDLVADLASGDLDLAVGYLPFVGKEVHRKRLFRERFVYVMRHGHPLSRRRLRSEDLGGVRHVIVNQPGLPHAAQVVRVAAGPKVSAEITLQVRSFTSIAPIVAGTDLVAVVPSNLATLVSEYVNLTLVKSPVKFPGFDVSLATHRRFENDPGLKWLRTMFTTLFGNGR